MPSGVTTCECQLIIIGRRLLYLLTSYSYNNGTLPKTLHRIRLLYFFPLPFSLPLSFLFPFVSPFFSMAFSNEGRDRIFSGLRSSRLLLPVALLLSLILLGYNLFGHVPTLTQKIVNSPIVAPATGAFSTHETSAIQNSTLGVSNLRHVFLDRLITASSSNVSSSSTCPNAPTNWTPLLSLPLFIPSPLMLSRACTAP